MPAIFKLFLGTLENFGVCAPPCTPENLPLLNRNFMLTELYGKVIVPLFLQCDTKISM